MRLAKFATLGLVAFIALACGGVSIPTIPSFNIPSFSIPPIPTGLIPTPQPGESVDPAAGMCRLLSAAEVGTVMGSTVTITGSESDNCTYTAAQTFATLSVRTETGDLSGARFLLGDTAQDVTIAGYQGLKGTFVGSPLLYLQRGGEQLVFQGVLFGSDAAAALAKVEQLANVAAPRW